MSSSSTKNSYIAGSSNAQAAEEDLISYVEKAYSLLMSANMKALRLIFAKLFKSPTEEGFKVMMNEVDGVFDHFNTNQILIIKKSINAFLEGGSLDLSEFQRLNDEQDDLATDIELIMESTNSEDQANPMPAQRALPTRASQSKPTGAVPSLDSGSKSRKWSIGWKASVSSALNIRRRQRIRNPSRIIYLQFLLVRVMDRAVKKVALGPLEVVPKSKATREHLRNILSSHYLLGDLSYELQEEIIDAFQDVRVSAGTEIIKQGDVADNFYIIDVGDFDILDQKGSDQGILVRTKTSGDSLGELALMYDAKRNFTARATTHGLLWGVNRAEFKSILTRHFSGSLLAQVYFVQEGQVRMTWGATVGNAMPGRGAISGETLALLDRLEILGEAILLNDEIISSWNFNAAADQTEIICIPRTFFTKDVLINIRKGLQIQLASVGLQRVPAFLELNSDQIIHLAQKLSESSYSRGDEITRYGDILGADARIYVVQMGVISMHKGAVDPNLLKNRPTSFAKTSTSGTPVPSSAPASSSSVSASPVGKDAPVAPTQDRKTTERRAMSVMQVGAGAPAWTFPTYGVFGDECLQNSVKNDHHKASYYNTTISESPSGVIVLSISLADVISVLGPIQDVLSRISNLKNLRKVKYLEFLTPNELDKLSHSLGLRILRPGEAVYRAGEPGDRLYIVKRGTVTEVSQNAKGQEPLILGKGAVFGEDALMSNEARLVTMASGPAEPPMTGGAELFYLDRAVVEAQLGSLMELNEIRKREIEMRGLVKSITFAELQEIGLLGTGLFGKVKLVYSRKTKEHYALKCVSKAKVVRMNEEEHLRNEKMYMAELDHPFINRLIRTYRDQTHVYLLEELTTGRELFLFLQRVGRLQEWEAAFYAGGVLLALEYMHGKGIAYRDLKPENTLIAENGYPKLIDMGFAKRLYNRRTYSMCGTPDYMAPEIIKRQGHGKGVDYWALGCMIFEMITCTSPFNSGNDPPQMVFQKVVEGKIKFPPYMSVNAVDIVRKLLDPNPETRLGNQKSGIAEIKEHPFFTKEINFQLLIRQREEAPMVPPKVADFKSLCIPDDQTERPEPPPPNLTNWDDVF
ncbi:uncharacterized protein [Physcomitrium patens]|uniref:uncharacterized protein isoform X3 n=1 Tax=Physcomitrium patens TaxID=3218 RepID=UPI003CCDA500